MKKALSVFLMLALVGSVFAAEPVADVNIAEFKGEASVQWGVDLDSGKTGFKNATDVTLKLNLLNKGSKSTTGDGVWGELVIKTDGDTFAQAKHDADLKLPALRVVVDKAQINFGPAYIGIKAGDTQTGKLKMDAAVKSADSDNAVTLPDVGPTSYSQGIVAGYSNDMFNVAADLRSYSQGTGVWMVTWDAVNPQYLVVDGKLSPTYFTSKDDAIAFEKKLNDLGTGNVVNVKRSDLGKVFEGTQYTNMYSAALEGEFTGVENLSVKAGVSYNFGELPKVAGVDYSTLGYSASIGYKLGLTDNLYLRPQLGAVGNTYFIKDAGSYTGFDMAAGLLFGWGDIGVDAHPDVYFLADNNYKKVSPGVGVVAYIPVVSTIAPKEGDNIDLYETVGRSIKIVPSFFSGEIIPNLTSATYAEFVIGTGKVSTFGYTVASGIKYAISAGAGTITPQAGMSVKGNKDNASELLAKVGVEAAGFVSNTTFGVEYASGNLIAKPEAVIGTLNFKTKISF